MAVKFRKTYRLSVDLAGSGGLPASARQTLVDQSVTIRPPFTLEFSVERSTLADANSAEFTVYGLGATVRKQLYKDLFNTNEFRAVEFVAGYLPPPKNVKLAINRELNPAHVAAEESQLQTVLFRGNVYRAFSERDQPPWRTRIEAQTGNYAYQHAHTTRSYAAGTPKQAVIMDLVSDFPNLRPGAIGTFPGVLKRGQTYSGSSLEYIKDLTDGNFYVDNERIFCLNPGEYVPGTVPVISGETGLVGAPRREKTLVTVKSLFEPGLLVGQVVQLKSANSPELNGVYQLKGLAHQGVISDSVSSSVTTTATITNYDPLITVVPLL